MLTIFQSNNGLFQAEVNGIDGVGSPAVYYAFLRGQTYMKLVPTTAATTVWTVTASPQVGITRTVDYYSQPDGVLEIPLKKWVALAMAGNYVIISIDAEINGNPDRLVFYLNVRAGISCNDILAPRRKGIDGFLHGITTKIVIPPNVMFGKKGMATVAECSYSDSTLFATPQGTWATLGGTAIAPTGGRNNEITIPAAAGGAVLTVQSLTRVFNVEIPDDCADMVALQWTSMTGARRRHAFPYYSVNSTVEEAVSLLSAGDGFAEVKNVSNGFVIRITGLTAYSVWYYNDMINANDLHASLDGTGLDSPQTLAKVDGDTLVTPDGYGFYNFEAKIKYRHYDSF